MGDGKGRGKRVAKVNLPSKPCQGCGRPFAWRKKWARDWEQVKTCSDRCKGDLRRKTRAHERPFKGPSLRS